MAAHGVIPKLLVLVSNQADVTALEIPAFVQGAPMLPAAVLRKSGTVNKKYRAGKRSATAS